MNFLAVMGFCEVIFFSNLTMTQKKEHNTFDYQLVATKSHILLSELH
jgi:hypothetical protein